MTFETEFLSRSDPAYYTIQSKVREAYPNACISNIYKITNPPLEVDYTHVQQTYANPAEVRYLFFPTTKEKANAIAERGFRNESNGEADLGYGTYLYVTPKVVEFQTNPVDPPTSPVVNLDDSQFYYNLIVDATTGIIGQTSRDEPVDLDHFDTGVDTTATPKVYVVPVNNRIIPRYIVAFFLLHEEPGYVPTTPPPMRVNPDLPPGAPQRSLKKARLFH